MTVCLSIIKNIIIIINITINEDYMKKIVVTGVSTGIGYSTAKILSNSGYFVYGSVRNKEDAKKISKDLGVNFKALIFDVTDVESILNSVEIVKSDLKSNEGLSGLVNNAGIALGGPITLIDTDIFRKQFDVNFFGLIDVTKAFLPILGASKGSTYKGKIINISSVSGLRANPFVGPYSASKFALEAFSDSLRRELLIYGVDVILIEPGPIKTAIWDKTPDPEDNEFLNTDYESALKKFYNLFIQMGKKGLDADVIGERVKSILQNPKPSVRHIITRKKFLTYNIEGLMPPRWYDKMIGKALGLIDKK
jgi:hypothetical protein